MWQSFRKNPSNNAVLTIEDNGFKKSETFVFKTGGLIWATPVIDEKETIYVGSADKYFYSIDNTGNLNWKYKITDSLDSLIDSAGVILDDKVVIPGGDGYIHAVNRETGELIWKFKAYHAKDSEQASGELVNSLEGNIATNNGLLYAGSDNGYMYCLDKDGKEIWNFKTGMMIWSCPCFFDEKIAFGSLDGYLYLLDSSNGKLLDKKKIGEIKASLVYDKENNLIFVGTSSGKMYSFKILQGKLKKRWVLNFKKEIYSSAAYYQNNLYFAAGNSFYSVDYNGKTLWKYNTFSKVSSSPVIIEGQGVIFGAENGKLYALNFEGQRIWSFKTSDGLHKVNLDSSPAISKSGNIYVGSYNGNVYKIPYEYCLKNNDKKCEFGGNSDQPIYAGKNLKFEDAQSNLKDNFEAGLSEPLRVKMFAFKNNNYLENSALNSVKISISPNVNFSYYISSDGKYIDIIPNDFWQESTDYKISIKADYYQKTNFIFDLFKRFFLPKIEGTLSFSTKEKGCENFQKQKFFIKDLSLYQPLAMNTLVAAALDGQKYIAEFLVKEGNKIEIVLNPAYESDGKFLKINETQSRQIVLSGVLNGKYFVAKGSLELSAMGGTIPFKDAVFSGKIENNKIENGMFFTKINCLKIKGNSKNYNLPFNIISEICGRDLNITVLAGFSGESIVEF